MDTHHFGSTLLGLEAIRSDHGVHTQDQEDAYYRRHAPGERRVPSLVSVVVVASLVAATLAATAIWSSAALGAERFEMDTSGMVGFEVVNSEDGRMRDRDMVVIEYSGPIAYPMAENLRTIWIGIQQAERFNRVVLRLDSAGGDGSVGEEVVGLLAEIRKKVALDTLVGDNGLCASMCIGVFAQGERRFASPASSWMFHGASARMSNVPDPSLTARYFSLFSARGIGAAFIDYLATSGYASAPGGYWISGAELARSSDLISDLLPNWRPAERVPQLPVLLGGV
jgi:ATP-dependent protease ClpP protease subunit